MTDMRLAGSMRAYQMAIDATNAARREFTTPPLRNPAERLETIRVATLTEIQAGRAFLAAWVASEESTT